MSQASDEKIELFRQEIMAKAGAERDTILKEAEESKKQELDQEQDRQLEEIYRLMQEQINRIKLENARVISVKARALRQELYRQREQYLGELVARVRVELAAFTKTERYIVYLTDTARRLMHEYPSASLELREEDMVYAPALQAVFAGPIGVCQSPIAIGGLRLVDRAHGLSIDCTLDAALEEQRSWFYENSHLTVEQGGE